MIYFNINRLFLRISLLWEVWEAFAFSSAVTIAAFSLSYGSPCVFYSYSLFSCLFLMFIKSVLRRLENESYLFCGLMKRMASSFRLCLWCPKRSAYLTCSAWHSDITADNCCNWLTASLSLPRSLDAGDLSLRPQEDLATQRAAVLKRFYLSRLSRGGLIERCDVNSNEIPEICNEDWVTLHPPLRFGVFSKGKKRNSALAKGECLEPKKAILISASKGLLCWLIEWKLPRVSRLYPVLTRRGKAALSGMELG